MQLPCWGYKQQTEGESCSNMDWQWWWRNRNEQYDRVESMLRKEQGMRLSDLHVLAGLLEHASSQGSRVVNVDHDGNRELTVTIRNPGPNNHHRTVKLEVVDCD